LSVFFVFNNKKVCDSSRIRPENGGSYGTNFSASLHS
jgi:hypothetical protein